MDWKAVEDEYIDKIYKDKNKYIDDYNNALEKVKSSKALFRNQVVPYSYKPLMHTEKDLENFRDIGRTMLSIGDKIVDEYISSKKFREKFKFPKELEELIILDSGYDINVPMSRMDIFYDDENNYKFVEINTDGSSAMLEDNSFGEITLETEIIKDLEDRYDFSSLELINSWVDKSLEIYKSWDGDNKVKTPNVAIMDFKESGTSAEFEEFKKSYEGKGLKCKIVDPRDFKYINGKLYKDDFRIDLIYRRMVTFEMVEKFDEVGEFIKAYKDGAVCTIGSLRSQLIHNKMIFKILHEEETMKLFTKEEKRFIKNHIPYTGDFSGDEKILEEIKSNKNKYIMKPSDMNVGQGVFAGKDFNQSKWEEKVTKVWNTDYIFQEFIEPYKREFLKIEDSKIEKVNWNTIIGIFMYGEEFAGLYTRIGKENVVSSVNGYRAANIVVKNK